MIKIAMAIIITSMPNWPSVRYQGYIYPDMEECVLSSERIIEDMRIYAHSKGDIDVYFDYFCTELNSYPIEGFNKIGLGA
tara:strand:- start:736 stop:975 length:240 start_codon:yes stop_codon:yes gene_type:complete